MKKTSDNSVSRHVISNQLDVHPKLEKLVRKHLAHPFRKPFAAHNIQAFKAAEIWLQQQGRPLILDSFCGVGESTLHLARQYPDCAVIGIDKSAARLDKHHAYMSTLPENYLLVQADVDDFWRLARNAAWRPSRHFLLYPNPWPKSDQIKLRVHGSPVFTDLLALGGELELRSNWSLYVEEFARAVVIAGGKSLLETFHSESTITPFERKYQRAGQTLWRCLATAPPDINPAL